MRSPRLHGRGCCPGTPPVAASRGPQIIPAAGPLPAPTCSGRDAAVGAELTLTWRRPAWRGPTWRPTCSPCRACCALTPYPCSLLRALQFSDVHGEGEAAAPHLPARVGRAGFRLWRCSSPSMGLPTPHALISHNPPPLPPPFLLRSVPCQLEGGRRHDQAQPQGLA